MNINEIIKKIKSHKKLKYEELKYVVDEFTFNNLSEDIMSTFLLEIYKRGLSFKETLYLTNAMIETGEIINFEKINKVVVDKHSTGGVGDKITLIVGPIVAANGLAVAKMSGRSLGLTGGTIDKLESITGYNVNISKNEFIKCVNEIGVSVISQTEKIAVADKKIYALRDKIGAVDSIPLIASSIMSKKIASGAEIIVIDLKVGKGAFMKDIKSATKLAQTMIKIGKQWKKKVVVILSDMNSPLGNNIGNALEIKEVIDFFEGKREKRLERLALVISSYMIMLGKNISYSEAYKLALNSLKNNKAKEIFNAWINYQGGNLNELKENANGLEIKSNKEGYIEEINAEEIAKICNLLGAGRGNLRTEIDYAVGVVLNKNLYDKVEVGEVIAKVYYNNEISNIEEKINDAFKISRIIKKERDIIIKVIK